MALKNHRIALIPGTPRGRSVTARRENAMINNRLGGAIQMKKKAGYSAGPFSVDEIGFIQIAEAKVLAAAARGEIDLNRIAREELASRGLGLARRVGGIQDRPQGPRGRGASRNGEGER